MSKPRGLPTKGRPLPADEFRGFRPAPDVQAWVNQHILEEDGRLHNPDHKHVLTVDVRFMWASEGFTSKQRRVVGTAEEVTFRCNAWQRGRQEQQMREWFGSVPDYVITLDASYCRGCNDAAFCALVEHELYHVGHLQDDFGNPAFYKDGRPRVGIVGHDVEEFIGVVRRYGTGNPAGALARLADAARRQPEVAVSAIAGACGTCLRRVA